MKEKQRQIASQMNKAQLIGKIKRARLYTKGATLLAALSALLALFGILDIMVDAKNRDLPFYLAILVCVIALVGLVLFIYRFHYWNRLHTVYAGNRKEYDRLSDERFALELIKDEIEYTKYKGDRR